MRTATSMFGSVLNRSHFADAIAMIMEMILFFSRADFRLLKQGFCESCLQEESLCGMGTSKGWCFVQSAGRGGWAGLCVTSLNWGAGVPSPGWGVQRRVSRLALSQASPACSTRPGGTGPCNLPKPRLAGSVSACGALALQI